MDTIRAKACGACGVIKPIAKFNKNRKRSDGLQYSCRDCSHEIARAYRKARPEQELARVRRHHVRSIAVRQKFVRDYLAIHACVDCGERDPVVLQFDHVRGNKKYAIGILANTGGYGLETLKREIAKCDVRCANCHARKTYRQLGHRNKTPRSEPDITQVSGT